jgi:phosphoribosylamine--glycine ligase
MSARSILVVGNGGREHALVLALSASPVVSSIIVAPGNGGTAQVRKAVNVAAHGVAELVDLAVRRCVDLVVVGPEAPFADGLVDELTRVGIRCFGPCKAAAQLETSKVFAKEFMQRHSIPTARFKAFRDFAAAEAFCRSGVFGNQIVVKASGLAAGKGVILAASPDEAVAACKAALVDGEFGDAGREVVVEELLSGPEVSLLAFCDGRSAVPFLPASDHKRIFEFDRGLNTGGMGVIAPARALPAHQVAAVAAATLEPVLRGMAAEGHPFVGILFAGLMMTAAGPRVLEYNVRFGDPEAQALIPLLETDLLSVIEACLDGKLAATEVRFKRGAASCALVAAAAGYPGAVKKGVHITLPSPTQLPAGTTIFHAGTRIAAMDAAIGGQPDLVTDGGRVLAVSAVAGTLKAALREAYGVLGSVHFEGMQYRRDVGGCWHWPHREAAALGAAPTPIRSAATAGELAIGGPGAPLPRGDALRIGVLGSTRGTDLAPILAAITSGRLLGAQVVVVVSNRAEAGILEKAAAAGIPSVHTPSTGRSREVRGNWQAACAQQLDAAATRMS